MQIFVVVESYQWYKGADTTIWGVAKTAEEAKKILYDAIMQRFEGFFIGTMWDDDEVNEWIESRFMKADDGDIAYWLDEDDDAVTKFYISTAELKED